MKTSNATLPHGRSPICIALCIAIAIILSACAGSGVPGGGGNGGGNGGNNGGGGGTFGGRHFTSTVYVQGQAQSLTLDTTNSGAFTGTIAPPPPGVKSTTRAATSSVSGTFDLQAGTFAGAGTFNSTGVTITGSLPSGDLGGNVVLTHQGVNSSGTFGDMHVNEVYARKINVVTDSFYAGSDGSFAVPYVEGAGRMNPFTTWGNQPHDAYVGTLLRPSATTESPGIWFSADDGNISAGSHLKIVAQPDIYSGSPGLGECYLWYGEGTKSYVGVSGYVVIDQMDNSTHEYACHFENVEVKGSLEQFGGTSLQGIGRFKLYGNFVGNYAESDMFGPF